MKKDDPNISEEELLRLVREGKIFMEDETFLKMKGESFVRDIVQDILDKDNFDDTVITEVELDDHGNHISITYTGIVEVGTIVAIGDAFGDDPSVCGCGDNTTRLGIVNTKHEELIY